MQKRVVTFHYTLTNRSGEEIDSSAGAEPIMFLEGAGQIIPGLEVEVLKLNVGDKKRIDVAASEAYGERDETLVHSVPRAQLPAREIKVGDMFRAGPNEDDQVLVVTQVSTSHITLDANHPLAGQDLVFDIEITELRPATAEELSHGHAHGPDGHHHH